MINFGNISIADLRLGATQVTAAYLGDKQVWSLGPVVPKYDIQSIGRSISQQGTSIDIIEQAGETITLYIKTNASDLTNKQVCAAVYLNSTDVTPYASFAFSNVSLTGRYITGTTPDVSTWVPSGFPETYSTLYMKTWIQDAGSIDPADALGEVLDWTGEEPPPVSLLCFTAEQANSTLHLDKVGSPNAISLETSTNGSTWTDYSWSGNTGNTLTLANVGDKVYMRAKTENQTIGSSDSNYYKFIMSGKIAVSGNIQTLLKADGSRTDAPAYCYLNIFRDCTALTTASITLPAMTLNNACYQDMFGSCSSLTTGPAVLPATTLVNNCYGGMFHRCSALTAAPKLSATALVYNSCPNMFLYCSALSSIEVAFTAWTGGATGNWMAGVAASGTFTCPAELPDRRGSSNIPSGWTKEEPIEKTPLTFTAEQANSTVWLNKVGSPAEIYLETSTDGSTWTDYSLNTLTLANVGDKVYMRAKNENQTIGSSSSNYYNFIMTGQIAASGNIQTLLKADGSRTDAPACCYYKMFYGCSVLTSAPALPATTLASNCYNGMFSACQSLTSAPELPATTLAGNCYESMFFNCTSLTTAPSLPATTLANSCYNGMFYNCTSLTTAPATLPATILSSGCYTGMFSNCTSLTTAPALPAATAAANCYQNMFNSCSSLSVVVVGFSSWPSASRINNWLYGVAATGTFTCPAELPDTRGASNIPTGWTKVDTVQPLCFTAVDAGAKIRLDKSGSPDAVSLETSTDGTTWTDYSWNGTTGDETTLANVGDKVYFRAKNENLTFSKNVSNYYKFVNSTSNKIAASGNIQTLLKADGSRTDAPARCYTWLFMSMSTLTAAPKLPATQLNISCYSSMFQSCTSLTTAPALPATQLAEDCYYSMFSSCRALTTTPELPATQFSNGSYQEMFRFCTNLTATSTLPAPTSGVGFLTFDSMFRNCSNLSSVSVAWTSWQGTSNWLDGVAATGTFTCPSTLPDTRDASHIPTGWTKVDAA